MSQAASYSSKGLSALGKSFYSAHLESNSTDLGRYGDFISIMAVESGTTTVNFSKNNSDWYQTTNQITLSEGDVYVLATETQNDSNIGTGITSDKDIAVVSGSWSGVIANDGSGGGRDMGVTQLVPVDKLGQSYLVHEGLNSSYNGTHAVIVATDNSTSVSLNGSFLTSLNAGQHYAYNLRGNGNNLKLITSNKPVMVYYQGYTSSESSAKNNQGLFLVSPLLAESSLPSGVSHAHYGNKIWDLVYNNFAKLAYYILTSDPAGTTVTQNGSTVALTSWGATNFSYNVSGTTYYMYEKLDQNAPSADDNFYIENSNGKPLYSYVAYSSDDRGYFVSNQAFQSTNSCPTDGNSPLQNITADINDTNTTINLDTAFSDADGDNLTYTLTGHTSTSVVVTAISSNNLVLDPNQVGTSTLTIEASDGTCTHSQSFDFTVTQPANSCPTDGVFPLENLIADINDTNLTLNLDEAFSDADGGPLTYTLTGHTATSVVVTAISSNYLVLDPNQVGTSTLTIEASDGTCTHSQSFDFTVTQTNTCPTDGNFPLENISVQVDDSDTTINLDTAFTDNEDIMSYAITGHTDTSVVAATIISSKNLVLSPSQVGTSTITIEASDGTCTHNQSFNFTVNAPPIDTDTDGINDNDDLDDDNDGILDTDEGCIITYSYTNATANSNGEYTIFVITDGLVDSLPYDDGYIPGTMTFVANNLQTGSLTIEDNDDYLHDNYSGNGQITDSNGLQYIAGTTTFIASYRNQQ